MKQVEDALQGILATCTSSPAPKFDYQCIPNAFEMFKHKENSSKLLNAQQICIYALVIGSGLDEISNAKKRRV